MTFYLWLCSKHLSVPSCYLCWCMILTFFSGIYVDRKIKVWDLAAALDPRAPTGTLCVRTLVVSVAVIINFLAAWINIKYCTCDSLSVESGLFSWTVGPILALGARLYKQEAFEKCWAHSPQRAISRQFTRCRHCTVTRRLRIDVHDDNAWQRGPLWPHGMGPISPAPFPRQRL